MTSFTVEGTFDQKKRQLTWTDGTLSGDDELRAIVERIAANSHGVIVASGGMSSTEDHLSNPWVANTLMSMFLADAEIIEGALPEIPAPPEGGIQ